MSIKRFLPILTAIAAQILTLAMLLAVIQGLQHGFQVTLPLSLKLLLQSLGAGLLSYFFKQPRWWIIIQFIIPVAVVLALNLQIPIWVYPLAFFSLLFFFWNSAGERVPLYLSNKTTWDALGDLLEKEKIPVTFIDLGCGLAGTLVALAKRFPQHFFIGVETAPFPYIVSKIRCKLSGHANIKIQHKSIWDIDLSQFRYIYAFLSPEPMPRLFNKINSEAKQGTTFISNSFGVPESPATYIMELIDNRHTKLHIWKK